MKKKTIFCLYRIALFSLFLTAAVFSAKPSEAAKIADPASPDIAARVMAAPMMVVGTYDAQGRTNFGLFDRGGVATSKPETHIALCMERTSYTYRNIQQRKALTINLPSEAYAAEADLFGSFSGMEKDAASNDVYTDKLAIAGLAADKGKVADAPMIREFPVAMECELVSCETIDPESPFDLLIVKVVKVWVDERYANESGGVNPVPAGAPGMIFYNPGRGDYYGYYTLGSYLGKPETLCGEYEKKIPSSEQARQSSGGGGCDGFGIFSGALFCLIGASGAYLSLGGRARSGISDRNPARSPAPKDAA